MYNYDRAQAVKVAADEILIEALPPDKRTFALKIAKATGSTALRAWDGVHGYIVEFQARLAPLRLGPKQMKLLLADSSFRWVGATYDAKVFSVGM